MRILHIYDLNQVARIYAGPLEDRGHTIQIYQPSLIAGNAALPLKLAAIPWRVFDLLHVVGRLNPSDFDVVHIHWASYGMLGLASRIPFIVHCHGSDVRKRLQRRVFRRALTPILRRAAAVLCMTPDLLAVVQSVRPDARLLPAPVDTDTFAPVCRPEPSGTSRILLLTRLDPIKGVDTAFEGMSRFVQRHPEVRVRVLDWGQRRTHYRHLHGDKFEFVPPVPPEEVAGLIHWADAIIGQFGVGALGLSELQAMSCAKPVIASFQYSDAYSNPPPIFDAQTPWEIDTQLETLLTQPDLAAARGREARRWVIEEHDKRVLAARLELIYSEVAVRAK
jgi:glycosyltransferase involved in cell wall biosynthesis